jgi:hypothetical protein
VEKRTKHGNFRTCIKEGCDWEIEAPTPAEVLATPAAPADTLSPYGSTPVSAVAEDHKPKFAHPQEPATVGSGTKS